MNISSVSGIAKVVAALGAGGVLAGAIALGATGGTRGGDGASPPQAQVPEETPTSVVEATATSEPEPTESPTDREAVIPRTDCLPDEVAYEDPDGRFSLCYPETGVRASTHEPLSGAKRTVLTLREPPEDEVVNDAWVMTLTWSVESGLGLGMPSEETCPRYTGTVVTPRTSQYVEMTLDGRKFVGCLTTGILSPGSPPLEGQELMLIRPFAEDGDGSEGYIRIRVNSTFSTSELAPGRSQSVLDKLRIE